MNKEIVLHMLSEEVFADVAADWDIGIRFGYPRAFTILGGTQNDIYVNAEGRYLFGKASLLMLIGHEVGHILGMKHSDWWKNLMMLKCGILRL